MMRIYGLYQKNRTVMFSLLALGLCVITVGCVGTQNIITSSNADKITSGQSYPTISLQLIRWRHLKRRILTVHIFPLGSEASVLVVYSPMLINILRSVCMYWLFNFEGKWTCTLACRSSSIMERGACIWRRGVPAYTLAIATYSNGRQPKRDRYFTSGWYVLPFLIQ